MASITIVIPVYQELPVHFELISMRQGLKILSKHPFSLVFPEGLNVRAYEELFQFFSVEYTLQPFEPLFFKSNESYDRLMLSADFYERFIYNDYVLIYQLDSFVFQDDLEKWCGKGFDFIGAPFVFKKNGKLHFNGVGNGGFSLRNPKSLTEYLRADSLRMSAGGFWKLYSAHGLVLRILQIPKIFIRLLGYRNQKAYFFNQVDVNEDYVFGFISQHSNHKLNVPSVDVAMQFAYDECPADLFKCNQNKLPFGCHGWYKTEENLTFWKQFIKVND